ncbi:hypothetical protein SASPL_140628 [Salvia splendens]|uniref:DUF4005 domain-containing protein n=1 Tax=Salvia splendens TaxID=180675 RepID=A0A8X8WS14_SALSN|nr:protein IQ-DOMAIN 17-like [Salvia splendens]KAG6399153.1 hypothetical protein SASPL_140628 [Salvia splendens]
MAKKSSTSWLTAVKRAFRSPTKDSDDADSKSCRRKVEHHHHDDEAKKSERRRWLFRKHSNNNAAEAPVMHPEQRHAIEVATAKVAVGMIRMSSNETGAARVIQTAFRGYLARRALVALKGIVKLQALIRGQNVRKQANMTMKCMQSLLRVQARVRDHRARLSHDSGRRSMFAETTNFRDSSKYLRHRNSRSTETEGSCVTDEWRPQLECPRTLEELEAILKARNEAALAHEKSLALAFAQQNNLLDSDRSAYNGDESELVNRTNWLDKWMATKQWETTSRSSIKTVQIDSLKTTNSRRSLCQSPIHRHSIASPHHKSLAPSTPSLASRTRSPQIRPRSYSTANTPSLRSAHRVAAEKPNYMAATESAKARIRSQSGPERERGGSGARKRLSYPVPEPYCLNFGFGSNNVGQNQRSPSFKSVQAGYVGMEEQSNYSYYTESVGGEISPCSTTELRRWLR